MSSPEAKHVQHVASKAPVDIPAEVQHAIHAEALSGSRGAGLGPARCALWRSAQHGKNHNLQHLLPHPARGHCLMADALFALQDAWNLRGTFSLSVGVLAAAIIPLFAIFVRYSDKLSYR